MARIIEYPRASYSNAFQLAEAVDALGGNAKIAMAAEKMGRKLSGAFNAVVSASVKYSLVSTKDGRLGTTPLFRSIKLAYTDDERRKYMRDALLTPPIFDAIAKRFSGKQLPVEHFDRLLIREFGVSDEIAPRVATYFMEGARQAGMLTADNVLEPIVKEIENEEINSTDEVAGEDAIEHRVLSSKEDDMSAGKQQSQFSVIFRGPGLNSTVVISDEDDIAIVEATLRKITKALKSNA